MTFPRHPWVSACMACCLLTTGPLRGVELVSAGSYAKTQKGASTEPSISGDGRHVVFSSLNALLEEDKNAVSDVYLKDRQTGELRLLSDDRGGDQPLISANGRFVVFRALDAFPQVRLVDLDKRDGPRTISYPFGGGTSFRYADSAAISPDGRFVAFPLRPIPGFNNATDPKLCVNDTTQADRLSVAPVSITDDFLLRTLGRSAMARTGNEFFLETSEGLVSKDTNQVQDIYMAKRGTNFVVRLSATENGLPEEEKGARDPVITAAGDAVFFISERRLRQSDTDGRATIYRSKAADNFATPEPVATAVIPLALSRQATGNGAYLVFLGQPAKGAPQPYLMRIADGQLTALAPSAAGPAGAPVISADNGWIAFASTAGLALLDKNKAADVLLVPNPDPAARLSAPQVAFNGLSTGAVIDENTTVTLSATASDAGPGILFAALELDGKELVRTAGTTAQAAGIKFTRGLHTLRAAALNNANVPGLSPTVTFLVRPGSNSIGLAGVISLLQTSQPDGSTDFSGTVRVDNTFAGVRGALQLVITETPAPAKWEFFGNLSKVPERSEQVLGVFDLGTFAGNSNQLVNFSSTASAPEVFGDGFQGNGWMIRARLRELVGGSWSDRDTASLFDLRPRLNEQTPGPNGGIPVLNGRAAPPFDPALLQSIQISGAANIVEKSSSTYRATAVFNTGSKPCTPKWEVLDGGSFATISGSGVLTVGGISSTRLITLRATFGGRSQTLPVTIKSLSPVISILASAKTALEGGVPGAFKIMRSQKTDADLLINYVVLGSASAGDDYTALPGSVTIPAGVASVTVPVSALSDADFEGLETVIVRLLPSGGFRLGTARSATVSIEDAQLMPPQLPDAIIRGSDKRPVGAFVFQSFDGSFQQGFARGTKNKASVFACQFANRSDASQTYTITGASDFLGFNVQYFDGKAEVTAAVVAGTFQFANVPAGMAPLLTVKITPTDATPLHASMRCPITARQGGFKDVVEAVVERVR